jgi:hypothetical protein
MSKLAVVEHVSPDEVIPGSWCPGSLFDHG